ISLTATEPWRRTRNMTSSSSDKFAASMRSRAINFDYVDAHGWYGTKFPLVHDESRVLDVWVAEACAWLRDRGIVQYSWCFAHGRAKDGERISPVFYFRTRFEALQFTWRFSGELIKEKE
ncbi:hypothetical protein P2L35_13585, partial [Enterococcus faecium]